MRRHARSYRHHLIAWACMGLYLLAAPHLHDRFFVSTGKPVQEPAQLPGVSANGHANIDAVELVDAQQGLYLIAGWGFVDTNEEIPAGNYERRLVLASAKHDYVFAAANNERPDVQRNFLLAGMTMDLNLSGFVSYVNRSVLPQGTYRAGLLLLGQSANEIYYVETGHCLTRTPNTLILQEPNDRACVESAGLPIQVNLHLPPPLLQSEAGVDGLNQINADAGLYELVGWAFPRADKNRPAADFDRQLVLISSRGNYVFAASAVSRPDVQTYFSSLEMDLNLSGFSAKILSSSLRPGIYSIALLFTEQGGGEAYLIQKRWCLRATNHALQLEPFESPVCLGD